MSAISTSQPGMARAAQQQNYLSDARFSSYVRKQSISAYESLDAGLTIQTKEGDLVTLTSSSFSKLDAHMYDSRGVLQTQSGMAMATQNSREITLSSGESFSFSVVGDLSEAELTDIEAIVKGIDGIIAEMAAGDMDDAIDKALSMGGYDTVSMYAADLSYKRSYQMASHTTYQANSQAASQAGAQTEPLPELNPEMLPNSKTTIPSVSNFFPENYTSGKHKDNTMDNINKFVKKMTKQFAKHEDKLVEKAQKPIDKLFRHHLKEIKHNRGSKNIEKQPIYTAIDEMRKKIDELIEQMTKTLFKDDFQILMDR